MEPTTSRLGDDVTVIGMLGGPGSGKGTQCALLAQNFNLRHISIGDIMRQEQARPGSPYAEVIRQAQLEGNLGPIEITMGVLRRHLGESVTEGTKVFLLDGFPRALERAEYFEERIGDIAFIICLDCPASTMMERLSGRGRFDDSDDAIRKRIGFFRSTTSKVLEKFSSAGKVQVVDATQSVADVQRQLGEIIAPVAGRRTA